MRKVNRQNAQNKQAFGWHPVYKSHFMQRFLTTLSKNY